MHDTDRVERQPTEPTAPTEPTRLQRQLASLPPWARWTARIVALSLALGAAAATAVALLIGIALCVAHPNLPEVSGLTEYRPKLPMRIFAADGVLLAEFGEERRSFMPIGQIPQVMKDAVLAIEDARFFQHSGVDYKGLLRAGMVNFGESRSQGASTITMQLARNFYLSTEKTFTRKIYEILLAMKIESLLSKEQILEVYMNQIYLGQRAYGFASASEIYFGKPLSEIGIAEAAMLAGLPKAPSAYNPISNPKRAKERQQHIIDRMEVNGYIDEVQQEAAKAQVLRYRRPSELPAHAEHVAEVARQLIFEQYGDEAYSRGLNVYLTLNSADQNVAYRALRKGLMDYERRQVYRGPQAYTDLPADPHEIDARVAEVLLDHPDNDELKAAVVLEASPRKVVAMLQSGETVSITGDGLKPAASGLADKSAAKIRVRRGAVIRITQAAKGDWTITQLPEVEGAFIALDPRTGAVRAMIGGFAFAKSKFNHVTQAWRQPGSSFKPFIYSAALEQGFTPATVINDGPLFFDADATGSQPWEPKNYDGGFEGPMSLRRGLAKSKNMISIRILQAIGPAYARNWLTRFGFDLERHPAYLTMALGAGSVTPMQMANAYAVFANGGYRVHPTLIARITDTKGRVLSEAVPSVLDESSRTLSARNVFVMSSLLQEVTRSGTAADAQAKLKRRDVYGKTGTTNDSQDAWFAGWQRSVLAVVWIGYDAPRKLGARETGGGLALPVWIDYMTHALQGVAVEEPEAPPGVVNVDNEWFFTEFAQGQGVSSLGLEENAVPAPQEEERKGILDLFRR